MMTGKTTRRHRFPRGNQRAKWARKAQLMDGRRKVDCADCGKILTEATVCVGRIDLNRPYVKGNLQPVCALCASKRGAKVTNTLHAPDETHILRFRVYTPPDGYCARSSGLWHVAAEPYDLSVLRESYEAACGVTSQELVEARYGGGDIQWSCATWSPAGRLCPSCCKILRRRKRQ